MTFEDDFFKKFPELKGKIQYTASVFKDVERVYGINFVGKELYEKIGKDKTFGFELINKEDVVEHCRSVEKIKEAMKNIDVMRSSCGCSESGANEFKKALKKEG